MRAAALRVRDVRLDAVAAAPLATPLLLVALLAVSTVLRTRILDAGYWIDEGISVGIASHPFTHIPHVLRHDGAPPLYYLLLHVWMKLFGESEARTHTLSLLFALAGLARAPRFLDTRILGAFHHEPVEAQAAYARFVAAGSPFASLEGILVLTAAPEAA